MTTRSVHSVKHLQAGYRKNQVFAIVCAFLTITAAMLAAFSGMRLNSMKRESLATARANSDMQAAAASKELAETRQALTQARTQLNTQREQITVLKEKLDDVERKLAAAKSKLRSQVVIPAVGESESVPVQKSPSD